MTFAEALAQAFKLFVTVVSYAFDQAKAREARLDDWRERQAAFETMVTQALTEMRLKAELESKQVDVVDDETDKAITEATNGKASDRIDDLQQRANDSSGAQSTQGDDKP